MAKNELHIDLNDLSFDLWYEDKGITTRHMFDFIDGGRAHATLVTKQYQYVEDEWKNVGSTSEQVTVDVCKDASRDDRLIWALKGIWGLPTKYGRKET